MSATAKPLGPNEQQQMAQKVIKKITSKQIIIDMLNNSIKTKANELNKLIGENDFYKALNINRILLKEQETLMSEVYEIVQLKKTLKGLGGFKRLPESSKHEVKHHIRNKTERREIENHDDREFWDSDGFDKEFNDVLSEVSNLTLKDLE
jgi:hypothetical protein